MFEKIRYVNHINEELKFGSGPLYVDSNDLHDFTWTIVSKNDRISGFKKGVVKKTIPVILKCDAGSGAAWRNTVFEICEKDILAQKPGRLFVGNYYLKCYITASVKKDYLTSESYMKFNLIIQTDSPQWIKETAIAFGNNSASVTDYLDFPYDFAYDLKSELLANTIINTGFVASNFRITIYGFSSNPKIYIAGHEYSVEVVIQTGEYLIIDSTARTVTLYRVNGEAVNCYGKRNRDSYIFKKIPAGSSPILSPDEFINFSVTLLDERSEPKWT